MENYALLDEELRIGNYVIQQVDGVELVTWCNHSFARLLGYVDRKEVIGRPIRDLHGGLDSFLGFRSKIQELERAGRSDFSTTGPMTTRGGEVKTVEVAGVFIRNQGKISGRIGILRDRTGDSSWIAAQAFHGDFASLLHGYSTHIFQLRSLVEGCREALQLGDSVAPQGSPSPVVGQLLRVRDELQHAVSGAAEDADLYARAKRCLEALEHVLARPTQTFGGDHPPGIASLALDVAHLALALPKQVSAMRRRSLVREATELHLQALRPEVELARETLAELEYSILSAREFIFRREFTLEDPEPVDLRAVVEAVLREHRAFAASRGIRLLPKGLEEAPAIGRVRDLRRAVGNLLHNAIKYSWFRQAQENKWVEYRVGTRNLDRGGTVSYCEFENYGVGIALDEITSGHIYRMGTRGRWSTDRGRIGTGLGLPDSRRVAQGLGGGVSITSSPVHSAGADHEVPHITTATLWVPYKKVD
jgi:PAS domain S-box-containing protein